MHFHKPQAQPSRWGSFADVQYAIRVNSEKIYGCDPDDDVLVMPLFWGLPCWDYSGYNNHGTNHGATYKDGSLDFDGNDYVDCGSDSSLDDLDTKGGISVSAWINPRTDGVGDTGDIISKRAGQSGYLVFSLYGTAIRLHKHGSTDLLVNSNFGYITFNQQQHITMTWDGSTTATNVHLYVNRAETAYSTQTDGVSLISDAAQPLYVGGDFDGPIDEVRIAKVVRTADQIALFHDNKYGLYQKVSRPIWSIPAAGVTIPIFMQNMRGSFNSPGTRGGFIN